MLVSTNSRAEPVLSSRARACRRNRQVPRVPLPDVGVTSIRETCSASSEDITPRSSLLQTHAPIPCGSPLLRFVASFEESVQVATRPCCHQDLPDVILRVFPVMLGPLPRRFADCFYLLLHLHHRPSPTVNGSACRFHPLKRLHSGGLFAGCSHFLMFRPHSLLATLVAPTTTVSCRAVSDVYIRAKRASFPPHVPDMLAVRNRQLTAQGLSPR